MSPDPDSGFHTNRAFGACKIAALQNAHWAGFIFGFQAPSAYVDDMLLLQLADEFWENHVTAWILQHGDCFVLL